MMTDTPIKRCARGENCVNPQGSLLPATLEYFRADKRMRDGLSSWCINCHRAYDRERHQKSQRQAWRKDYRQKPEVKRRHADQSRSYYHTRGGKEKQRERRATPEYRAKDLLRHKSQEVKQRDKERKRKLRQIPEYRERQNYWLRIYRQSERGVSARRKWWEKPASREKNKVKFANRRARQLALPNTLTAEQSLAIRNYWHGQCAICGRSETPGLTIALDHWIPLSSPDCPGTVATNIVPLCHGLDGCNNSKGDRLPNEWLISKFGAAKAEQIFASIAVYFEWVKRRY